MKYSRFSPAFNRTGRDAALRRPCAKNVCGQGCAAGAPGWIWEVFSGQARKDDAEFAGGAMSELGCHLIDAAVAILGRPQQVHSFLQRTADDGLADNTLAVHESVLRACGMPVDG